MNRMNEKLLNCLSVECYITARKLGEQLFFNEKTIRNYIKELDEFLHDHGAYIETKNGKGFRLVIDNEKLFYNIYQDGILKDDNEIPTSIEERVNFIITYLLCHSDYAQIEELISILCISESTLMADLRRSKQYLREYDVKIEIKFQKGIRVVGTEFNLRSALTNYVMMRGMIADYEFYSAEQEKKKIFSVVEDSLSELDISMSEISMQSLTMHLFVAVKRIKRNKPINISKDIHEKIQLEFSQGVKVARRICERLEVIFHMCFSEDELDYVIIYLAGNRVTCDEIQDADNIVILQYIQELVKNMLQYVYVTMKVDFRNNFSVIMALLKHVVAMDIRIKYNISLKNPVLSEIKEKYSRAYIIAVQSAIVLENHYQKKIREDEIGYLAIIFNLYLDDLEENAVKKNILIICAMGKTSAQLLAYQYRKVFGKYLNKIEISNRSNLNHLDLNDIDYILTTTPISLKVPIPVIEIKVFLDNNEISSLLNKFSKGNVPNKELYYGKELFFHKKRFNTKESLLQFMCKEISEWREIPVDFYDSVLLRESYGSTDFGEMVAMPHPYGQVTKVSFAAVCILEEPIEWGNHHVQMIILVSLSDQEDENRDLFFEVTSEFIMNKQKVKSVIENPTFQNFIQQIEKG